MGFFFFWVDSRFSLCIQRAPYGFKGFINLEQDLTIHVTVLSHDNIHF